MIAYVDASVLLRVALGEPNALPEWPRIERGVSSALLAVECLRTLDRVRLRAGLADQELAARRGAILSLIASLEIVDLDAAVLERAAQPMPTQIGTLDAIHLATALLWKEQVGVDPLIATHDDAFAVAAEAYGLAVIGVTRG